MTSIFQLILPLFLFWKASAETGYVYQPHLVTQSIYGGPTIGPTFAPTASAQIALPRPQSRIINNKNQNRNNLGFLSTLNVALPTFDTNYLSDPAAYVVDGRVLKQYLVQEEQLDDLLPPNDLGTNPILLNDFANIFDKYTTINQNYFRIQASNGPAPIIQPVTRNHGPVALGSGSLGYIRRPNGSVFLGSGSLGYISNEQRVNDVNDVRAPKGNLPGPTSFGDSVSNPFL